MDEELERTLEAAEANGCTQFVAWLTELKALRKRINDTRIHLDIIARLEQDPKVEEGIRDAKRILEEHIDGKYEYFFRESVEK